MRHPALVSLIAGGVKNAYASYCAGGFNRMMNVLRPDEIAGIINEHDVGAARRMLKRVIEFMHDEIKNSVDIFLNEEEEYNTIFGVSYMYLGRQCYKINTGALLLYLMESEFEYPSVDPGSWEGNGFISSTAKEFQKKRMFAEVQRQLGDNMKKEGTW